MKNGYVCGGLLFGGATAMLAGMQVNDCFVTKAVTGTIASNTHYVSDAALQAGALLLVAGFGCVALAGLILLLATLVTQIEDMSTRK
jgi:hypothetical protein